MIYAAIAAAAAARAAARRNQEKGGKVSPPRGPRQKPLWYYEPYTKWRRPSPDDSPWYRFRRWLAVDIFGWLR
jgi:hypothetical protein